MPSCSRCCPLLQHVPAQKKTGVGGDAGQQLLPNNLDSDTDNPTRNTMQTVGHVVVLRIVPMPFTCTCTPQSSCGCFLVVLGLPCLLYAEKQPRHVAKS